jgi:hypothetical protein
MRETRLSRRGQMIYEPCILRYVVRRPMTSPAGAASCSRSRPPTSWSFESDRDVGIFVP